MTLTDPDLWNRIRTARLTPHKGIVFGSEATEEYDWLCSLLEKQGDWTPESARRIVSEYRKFLYLKAVDGGLLTPSVPVDEAWHLHLEFKESYERFCAEVAGTSIRHETGLSTQQSCAAYKRTVSHYRSEFGMMPNDIWPEYRDMDMVMAEHSYLSYPWFVVVWAPCLTLIVLLTDGGEDLIRNLVVAAVFFFFFIGIHASNWTKRPEKVSSCG